MTNYYNSGLYMESFFTQYRHLCLDFDHILEEMLTCSYGLFQKYYSRDLDYKDDDDLKEQICNLFIDDIACYSLYFQPQIFDEEIALECSLTPFTHDGLSLLALSGWGADLSPKLDAYQGLTHNTIDENSCLFSDFDYFQGLLGENLTNKVLQTISYNK